MPYSWMFPQSAMVGLLVCGGRWMFDAFEGQWGFLERNALFHFSKPLAGVISKEQVHHGSPFTVEEML